MALSLIYVKENLSGMTVRIQKNKHAVRVSLGPVMRTNSFPWGSRVLTRGSNPQPS